MSSPPSPYQDEGAPESSAPQPAAVTATTRTVAIIKTHALKHRFDIEPRILEAGFEIVKERQMEFDTESDPEFLIELFGDDAHSLAEGPVWVYVLERRRAVEVWNTLMSDPDPAVAREMSPNSLRALYGISLEQNGLMGSPDVQMAEIQIASLFASSPPFHTSDLPDDLSHPGHSTDNRMYSADSTGRSSLHRATSNPSSAGGTKYSANGKPLFRARPLPKTHDAPDIAPRTTKAASLRALGEKTLNTRWTPHAAREVKTKAKLREEFMNVPGHKRAESIAVASTAAPTIAPRMTKAASLRIAKDAPKPVPRIKASTSTKAGSKTKATNGDVKQSANTFEGVPGHKRRETISVASTAEPVVAPRQNRSAALRAQKDAAPPSAFMTRASSLCKTPGISRTTSQTSLSPPRHSSRPASVASGRPSMSRSNSALSIASPTSNGDNEDTKPKKPRPTSLQAPSIAPRPNKSATLRAAKKEEKPKRGIFV
jgi:nucleoside diphosphate kinase